MDEKEKSIRKAAKAVCIIIRKLKEEAIVGSTGIHLDKIAKILMEENEVTSSCFKYKGFPSNICVSVNHNLTHGIPNSVPFKNGDIVSVDVACNYNGYHADAAATFLVGEKNEEKSRLIRVTKDSLNYVISRIVPNKTTTRDIGSMLQKYANSRGYKVIKEYGGHGIGKNLHEEPFIPNYRINERGHLIREGMFICIEPLFQISDDEIALGEDG
jgi:methionyl aminopeptidase